MTRAQKLIAALTGLALGLVILTGPRMAAQDIRRSIYTTSKLLITGAGAVLAGPGACTSVTGSDLGSYLYVCNGSVNVNSASLQLNSSGSAKVIIPAPTVDGQFQITNGSGATGVGLDVATDGVLKIKSRAQTNDATVQLNNIQSAAGWIAGYSGSQMYFGESGTPTRLRTSMATPGTLANGDWWVESDTGAITGASGALKAQLNGATVFVSDAIRRVGRFTGQTAAKASVAAYTVGAADGSFELSGNINITTLGSGAFQLQATYTDETNTARTTNLLLANPAGSSSAFTATTAGPWSALVTPIRAKAATVITILTPAGGTYTGCTYNVEGTIKQVS